MVKHGLSAALAGLAALALLMAPRGAGAEVTRARFQIPARSDQLIVVSSPTYNPPGHLVTFRAYARSGRGARWRTILGPWPAEIGYGALRDRRHEGDGSTPTGVFEIGARIYGNRPNPGGLDDAYHHLICGDWWDEDPYSPRYNRFVHLPCGVWPGFAHGSEALWTESVAYPYFAVIRFNVDPTVGGHAAPGSAIFLHSWVNRPTAGCVALPQERLLAVLRWLRPSAHPVIEIGTEGEVGRSPTP